MKTRFVIMFVISMALSSGYAQDATVNPRPITLDEYKIAKTFDVKDLDKDTYVKIENTYILDRYEMRKPYFITGDDGLKKRIDLYKLFFKVGMQELATVVFYTTEKGKTFKAVIPNFTADAKVWQMYFEDIHAINKVEENFMLKLSYLLSKELSFQQYKALNQGKDISKESATYGNDICFPGNQLVTLKSGFKKELKDVHVGDEVLAFDPISKQVNMIRVKALTQHEAKNYAIARVVLINAKEDASHVILLSSKVIEATPNHPMLTSSGVKQMGAIEEGEFIICYDEKTQQNNTYQVFNKQIYTGAIQNVYNLVADEGETFIINDVMVLQK